MEQFLYQYPKPEHIILLNCSLSPQIIPFSGPNLHICLQQSLEIANSPCRRHVHSASSFTLLSSQTSLEENNDSGLKSRIGKIFLKFFHSFQSSNDESLSKNQTIFFILQLLSEPTQENQYVQS